MTAAERGSGYHDVVEFRHVEILVKVKKIFVHVGLRHPWDQRRVRGQSSIGVRSPDTLVI